MEWSKVLSLCIGIASMVITQGLVVIYWLNGIARNPEAGKEMFTPAIIGLAFLEVASLSLIGCLLANMV